MIREWAFLRLDWIVCKYLNALFTCEHLFMRLHVLSHGAKPARPSRRPSDRATHEKCEHILVINAANLAPSQEIGWGVGELLLCLAAA